MSARQPREVSCGPCGCSRRGPPGGLAGRGFSSEGRRSRVRSFDVWPVIAGGVLAFVTKWVLDGGIRTRDRRIIREELELAALLGETPEAADLQAMAHMRLIRYMRPSLLRRAAPIVRSAVIFVVAIAAGESVMALAPDGMSDNRRLTIALAVGASVGVLAQAVQALWEFFGRLREEEAYAFGWRRR